MVFKHMKEDVLRIAKMIDRSAGEPKMFSEPVYVEFPADYALFSRPEYQVDKISYPAPTFSALRNAMQSIYWHPGFNIIPVMCLCRNPIIEENIGSNGVDTRKKPEVGDYVWVGKQRMQRTQRFLRNVKYDVAAFIVSRPDATPSDKCLKSYYSELTRHIGDGHTFKTPYGDSEDILLKSAVAQSVQSWQVGYDTSHLMCSYAPDVVKGIYQFKIGDRFVVETSYGDYVYSITNLGSGTVDSNTGYIVNTSDQALFSLEDTSSTVYLYTDSQNVSGQNM